MNKFKLILTICTVAVLILTMGVATFASNPLIEGGEQYYRVVESLSTWTNLIDANESDNAYTSTNYVFYNNTPYVIDWTDEEGYQGVLRYVYNENEVIYLSTLDIPEDDINLENVYIIVPDWQLSYFIDDLGYAEDIFVPIEYENNTILSTFSAVPAFLVNAVNSATGIFWANGALTMLGILAIIAVAFGVCLLVVSLITRFMSFRG